MSDGKESQAAGKKHIIDVEEPGKSAPTSTSKPVIVTNRPILKDPMVVEEDSTADDKPDKKDLKHSGESTIQPLSSSPEAAHEPHVKHEEPAKEAEASTPLDDPDKRSEEPEDKAPEPDKEPEDTEKSDETDKTTNETEKKLAAEAAAQAKHDTDIEKLVDSKEYELPINTVEKQKSKQFVILGTVLAVLLVLAWLDIALDAHIISLGGLHAPTHFFSN